MPELFMSVLYDRDSLRKKTNPSLDVMVANKQHLFCYVLPSFSFMTGTLFEELDLTYLDSFTFKTMPLLCVAAWQCKVTLPPALQRKAPSAAGNFSTTPTFLCLFNPFHQRRGASSPNSRMHFSSCFGCKFEMCHAAVWIVSSVVSCKGRRSKPAGGSPWLPFRNAIET